MSNELVLFDKKFTIADSKILFYLQKSLKTKLQTDGEKFVYCLTELYRLPVLKPLLDVILSECKKGNANFILFPLENWDRVAGHCRTTIENKAMGGKESAFKKGIFSKHYEIVIKEFIPDIIIHEIAHAIEHISGIDINRDFRRVFAEDMHNRNARNMQLLVGIDDIMKEQLKNYELPSIMAELFARLFEMFAMSKEVGGWGKYQFTYLEISKFFCSTIAWLEDVLFPLLKSKTDTEISNESCKIIENLQPYKKEWTKKFQSKFANSSSEDRKWRDMVLLSRNSDVELSENVVEVFDNLPKEQIKKLDSGVEYFEFKKKNS